MHVTHGAQQRGWPRARVCDSTRPDACHRRRGPDLARIVAAPAMFPADADWHWTFDAEGRGFLLRADASAVAVAAATHAPPEIALAINQARRARQRPHESSRTASDGPGAAAGRPLRGVPIVRGASWSWDAGGTLPADATQAPDLRHGEFVDPGTLRAAANPARGYGAPPSSASRWPHSRCSPWPASARGRIYAIDAHRDRDGGDRLARAAGGDAQDFDGSDGGDYATLHRARHAAREPAPDDALPLLARAAPALAAMPPANLEARDLRKWRMDRSSSRCWTHATRDALIAPARRRRPDRAVGHRARRIARAASSLS